MHHILLNFNFLNFFLKHVCLIVLLFTYLLNILCIALVNDWFYIHQAYHVALIRSIEFYNKMMMMTLFLILHVSATDWSDFSFKSPTFHFHFSLLFIYILAFFLFPSMPFCTILILNKCNHVCNMVYLMVSVALMS
jgi:hypothetical protein